MTDAPMSNQELVDAAIELAGEFYCLMGYTHREGFKYYNSQHPQEQMVWKMACAAFLNLRGSDVEDALSDIEDESND